MVVVSLEVDLIGSVSPEPVMGPVGVVELDISGKPLFELGTASSRVQVDVFVLEGSPQSFDKDVTDGPSNPIH